MKRLSLISLAALAACGGYYQAPDVDGGVAVAPFDAGSRMHDATVISESDSGARLPIAPDSGAVTDASVPMVDAGDTVDAFVDLADGGSDASTSECVSTLCADGYRGFYDNDGDGVCNDCDVCPSGTDDDVDRNGLADGCDVAFFGVSDNVSTPTPPTSLTLTLVLRHISNTAEVLRVEFKMELNQLTSAVAAETRLVKDDAETVSAVEAFMSQPVVGTLDAISGPTQLQTTKSVELQKTAADFRVYRIVAIVHIKADMTTLMGVTVNGTLY